MRTQIILIVLLVSAVSVRCNSPSDYSLVEDNALVAVESQVAESENTGREHQVIIESMQFKPKDLQVHAGDRVVWINKAILVYTSAGAISALLSKLLNLNVKEAFQLQWKIPNCSISSVKIEENRIVVKGLHESHFFEIQPHLLTYR